METSMTSRLLLVLACLFLIALPVRAVDGVLEIHQACVAGGCFPGDDPGFPVEITEPGSYRLTGNLQVPDEDTTGIEITVESVTIDLNGFTIRGITECGTSSCSPVGDPATGEGVKGDDFVTVRNGFVESMGAFGILLGQYSVVEDVTARSNALSGIRASRVLNSVAVGNGASGVSTIGVQPSAVAGCIARLNHGAGIRTSWGSVVNSSSYLNKGPGIYGNHALVTGNFVDNNDGFGLELIGESGYSNNTLTNNNGGGPQVDGGIEIGTNLCGTDTNCP